jgi:hypothetical protein
MKRIIYTGHSEIPGTSEAAPDRWLQQIRPDPGL